jgi:carbamate kinase
MKTLVVALGGNALLQRGEALTVENQYRNIHSAVPALARLAQHYRLAIVHGNGPQVACWRCKIWPIATSNLTRWTCWWRRARA